MPGTVVGVGRYHNLYFYLYDKYLAQEEKKISEVNFNNPILFFRNRIRVFVTCLLL